MRVREREIQRRSIMYEGNILEGGTHRLRNEREWLCNRWDAKSLIFVPKVVNNYWRMSTPSTGM